MATETGPDLSFAREQVEALMDDTCVIFLDDEGTEDDVLDEVTGELQPPADDTANVYDETTLGYEDRPLEGRCKVTPQGNDNPRYRNEAGEILSTRWYNGSIPWDSPLPVEGAILRVTSSRRDPELVDQEFRVREVVVSTFLVARRMVLEFR